MYDVYSATPWDPENCNEAHQEMKDQKKTIGRKYQDRSEKQTLVGGSGQGKYRQFTLCCIATRYRPLRFIYLLGAPRGLGQL